MTALSKESVTLLEIGEEAATQRVDNYLTRHLKGVPKSHIYRIVRSGEVRVNGKRVDCAYRLQNGDRLRIPPIRIARREDPRVSPAGSRLSRHVLFEDEAILVLDKPAGLAVHGGSGISRGVIEQLRQERPELAFLELAHRLDRETSGLLILAKRRPALTGLHQMMREGAIDKRYLALVRGRWRDSLRHVRLPLHKYLTSDGERRVAVREDGQAAHTVFRLQGVYEGFSLLEAELKTGRTHQIRVHLAHLGYPIAGDEKYGDFGLNRTLAPQGLRRMFLHAHAMAFVHPLDSRPIALSAPLPAELVGFLATREDAAVRG
ncbi:MAG: RluA family pseudouridine synthase [Betaproteobacteria bacterium]|nr:RluA family pseudouridine synthase [Betaproteobacteria bacterium]